MSKRRRAAVISSSSKSAVSPQKESLYDGEDSDFHRRSSTSSVSSSGRRLLFKSVEYVRNLSSLNGRIDILEKCGEGAFSAVYHARPCFNSSIDLAVKIICPTFDVKRAESELLILLYLQKRKGIIDLLTGFRDQDHIILIMPYVPHKPFPSYFQSFTFPEIQAYIRALLEALKELHSLNILHRDIKPSNFLYDCDRQQFALVDFGLAHCLPLELEKDLYKRCGISPPLQTSKPPAKRPRKSLENKANFTFDDNSDRSCKGHKRRSHHLECSCFGKSSICDACTRRDRLCVKRGGTHGYRPPEVLLKFPYQTTKIDMWAVGCILATFLSGSYPFFHCKDDFDCLASLCHLFGLETVRELALRNSRNFVYSNACPARFSDPVARLREVCCARRTDKGKFPNEAYQLASSLLELDPDKRLSASQALAHPFFNVSNGYI